VPLRPRRVDIAEHMDEADADPAEVAGALDDLSRLNRWVGGSDLTLRALDVALERWPVSGRAVRVLDVATGAGDIPLAIVEHAQHRGFDVAVTGLDIKPTMLAEAGRRTGGRVELIEGDALDIPAADGAYDIVTCSLMLHHFPPAEAIRVLEEMRRVTSRAVIVNDLIRAWHPWLFAKAAGALVMRNPLTRHDGPASVLRAYTPDELVTLATAAGLTPRWRATLLGYRMALLAERSTR
jgi:SAM-dependent methyltransferase